MLLCSVMTPMPPCCLAACASSAAMNSTALYTGCGAVSDTVAAASAVLSGCCCMHVKLLPST